MNAQERALICAGYAQDKKAVDLKILDVRSLSSLTDYIVIATGRTDRQVQAVAENIRLGLKRHFDEQPLGVDGTSEGRWVLIDYGDVMVHIFQPATREFYDLDGLWRGAKGVEIPDGYGDTLPRVE